MSTDNCRNTDEVSEIFIQGIKKANAAGLKCSVSIIQTVSPAVSNR